MERFEPVLVKPGGRIVLEEPDTASWRVNPDAPATTRLVGLIVEGFRAAGGNIDAGRERPFLLRRFGLEASINAQLAQVEQELSRSAIWGTTVMLIQAFARVPS